MKVGRWKPGLQADLSLVVMWAFALEVLARGFDYFTGDRPGVTQSLTVVEAAMPIQLWGLLCLIAAGTFMVGVALRRWSPIIMGGTAIFAIYGALAMGMFLKMLERGWPLDGWRTPLLFMAVALLFGVYALSASLKRSAVRAEDRMEYDEQTE